MIYANHKSFTCDIEGTTGDIMSEVTIILSQFYKMMKTTYDDDFANNAVVEVGRMAVTEANKGGE